MRSLFLYTSFVSLSVALSGGPTASSLQKRESGKFSCYDSGNIVDFGGWCPTLNWPSNNDRGLSMMATLYFALNATNVPDDTVYRAQENIICTVNSPGPNITITAGAQVGNNLVGAGASVTFTLSFPMKDYSLCMFTEGTNERNVTDPITLAQARTLLYTMLTAGGVDCKTCGRIPIRYPNVTDGTNQGGILKIDAVYTNNCLGKCVGPNSFVPAAKSAETQLKPPLTSFSLVLATLATFLNLAWPLG